MIHYIIGDAISPVTEDGLRVITHIVNDAGKWGAGFSGALSKKWPDAEEYYRKQHRFSRERFKLGEVQWCFLVHEEELAVCSLIAQHDVRSLFDHNPIRYDALDLALDKMAQGGRALAGNPREKTKEDIKQVTFHMPRIGTGLAGGTWDRVEPLLEEQLWDFDVYVYDLPK
jgi:O-acetyl-ADP-ribose deacetylase (regulator of RNase III)